jgi:hypothetical protein
MSNSNKEDKAQAVKIALIEQKQSQDHAVLEEVRKAIVDIPKAMRDGFRELRDEFHKEHKADMKEIQKQIDSIKDNPVVSFYFWSNDHPILSKIVITVFLIVFFSVVISDLRHPMLAYIIDLL